MDSSLLLLICAVPLLGFGIILYGSIAKTRWGANFSAVRCPNCQTIQPRIRLPTDAYEAMWGGATCTRCETKMDKWGRLRT